MKKYILAIDIGTTLIPIAPCLMKYLIKLVDSDHKQLVVHNQSESEAGD